MANFGDWLEIEMSAIEDKLESAIEDELTENKKTMANIDKNLRDDLKRMQKDLQRMRQDMHNTRDSLRRPTMSPPPPKPTKPININMGYGSITVGKPQTTYKHEFTMIDEKNFRRTVVRFNDTDNYQISSEGDSLLSLDDLMMVKGRIRQHLIAEAKAPEEKTASDRVHGEILRQIKQRMDDRRLGIGKNTPLFYSRTLFGKKGKPLEYGKESKVSVSTNNLFGRKYQVEIDGKAIFMPFVETYMERSFKNGHIETFVEMRSDIECEVLRKIIQGIESLNIAEEHHLAVKELL